MPHLGPRAGRLFHPAVTSPRRIISQSLSTHALDNHHRDLHNLIPTTLLTGSLACKTPTTVPSLSGDTPWPAAWLWHKSYLVFISRHNAIRKGVTDHTSRSHLSPQVIHVHQGQPQHTQVLHFSELWHPLSWTGNVFLKNAKIFALTTTTCLSLTMTSVASHTNRHEQTDRLLFAWEPMCPHAAPTQLVQSQCREHS